MKKLTILLILLFMLTACSNNNKQEISSTENDQIVASSTNQEEEKAEKEDSYSYDELLEVDEYLSTVFYELLEDSLILCSYYQTLYDYSTGNYNLSDNQIEDIKNDIEYILYGKDYIIAQFTNSPASKYLNSIYSLMRARDYLGGELITSITLNVKAKYLENAKNYIPDIVSESENVLKKREELFESHGIDKDNIPSLDELVYILEKIKY